MSTMTARRLDYSTLRSQLGIRTFMELGLRDAAIMGDDVIRFKMGMAHATAHLWISLTPSDEYAFSISKTRGVKTTELAQVGFDGYGIDAENLARVIIAKWCEICTAKGW